ncbi:MAG TPA: DUF2804 domain-containing protein [Anaerolineales bacterium]|nr:DUF2804 domain-containing protein [Anaerolineales bacterium]
MPSPTSQREFQGPASLLTPQGELGQAGWSRHPVLDCNLEAARFYNLRVLQRLRIKRWDYYGITTPTHFFSATLADLGYAGQVFAYVVDLTSGECTEDTLTIPLGRGILLPRNSTEGESRFTGGDVQFIFRAEAQARHVSVRWPGFGKGRSLEIEATLAMPPAHESLVIVVPIGRRRFYYNRKVNCLPASGRVTYAGAAHPLDPRTTLGNLDWGRGVWEYRSFWIWASASGFLPDGRTLGLNLGGGFGHTSAATENAVILNGRIHKLGRVDIAYTPGDFMRPWRMTSPDGRLEMELTPFKERLARTNLLLITSEVHQMFGRYRGRLVTDDGETVSVEGLAGFSEEHRARW